MKPCTKCGSTENGFYNPRDSWCKRCSGEYRKAWRIQNRERHNASNLRWVRAHHEIVKERSRVRAAKQRKEHPEKQRQAFKKYYNSTKGKLNNRRGSSKRRARARNAEGSCSREQWLARLAFHKYRCRYCGTPLTVLTAEPDHMIPLSRGGTQWPSNLVPACRTCNAKKKNKTFFEFMALLGQRDIPNN